MYQYPVSVAVQAKGLKVILKLTKKIMNLTHGKLFVRRNTKTKLNAYRNVESKYNRSIKTVAQINENILLTVMPGKTSCDKLLDNNNAESLHQQLKPLLIMLQLLGCLPVYFSKSG